MLLHIFSLKSTLREKRLLTPLQSRITIQPIQDHTLILTININLGFVFFIPEPWKLPQNAELKAFTKFGGPVVEVKNFMGKLSISIKMQPTVAFPNYSTISKGNLIVDYQRFLGPIQASLMPKLEFCSKLRISWSYKQARDYKCMVIKGHQFTSSQRKIWSNYQLLLSSHRIFPRRPNVKGIMWNPELLIRATHPRSFNKNH